MILVLVAFYAIHNALLPFIVAGAVALMFDPLIEILYPYTGKRWIAAVIVFLGFLAVAGGFGYWAVTVTIAEVSRLLSEGPKLLEGGIQQLLGPNGISIFGQTYTAQGLTKQLEATAAAALGPGAAAAVAGIAAEALLGLILTLVLIPYFLVGGRRLAAALLWLIPPSRRPAVRRELPEIVPLLRRYFIGVSVVVIFTAIAAYIGFGLIFGLPHPALLSMMVGVLEIIPALGPATSMALVFISALEKGGVDWSTAFAMAYAIGLRLTIDNGVGPFVLGQSAKLHPVTVIFAFVVGGSLLGVLGLVLAVPATATMILILHHRYGEQEELSGGGEERPRLQHELR